jgi:L-alanine-DL-glutamate epimerase-like enolase superfamily enzyme
MEPAARPSDVEVESVAFDYEDYSYRTPIKFGGAVVDQVTLLNVRVTVRARSGRQAQGFGSMPLGNVWAWPSRSLSYDQTLHAMKVLAERLVEITSNCRGCGHPIEINADLEPRYLHAAAALAKELSLPEPIPKLSTLVVASPIDAAIHDGFGKANGINCYRGYGPEYMNRDLGHYLGPEFEGAYLDNFVSPDPRPSMPLYHLVGALDPIVDSDIQRRVNDGLPETLPEWILADALTHIKIKLNGDDLDWDVERVLAVHSATAAAEQERGVTGWCYSLDFNERCPSGGCLLEFLERVKSCSPDAFERVQYIEQPTARDLRANPQNKMHEIAKLKPVVIDESLVDYGSFLLARELGYSGVALKACKGQSNALLMAAAAQEFGMFLCVQDLTCPGASLLHSAGLAAHIPTVAAIESNARQYVPAANEGWSDRFPAMFKISGGRMGTAVLNGPGLGIVAE